MPGRIEYYVHSDASVENKVGCLVEVTTQTDFAAKDEKFVAFTGNVAKYVCAFRARTWQELLTTMNGNPIDLAIEKTKLERDLKETIEVAKIALLTLDGESFLSV